VTALEEKYAGEEAGSELIFLYDKKTVKLRAETPAGLVWILDA